MSFSEKISMRLRRFRNQFECSLLTLNQTLLSLHQFRVLLEHHPNINLSIGIIILDLSLCSTDDCINSCCCTSIIFSILQICNLKLCIHISFSCIIRTVYPITVFIKIAKIKTTKVKIEIIELSHSGI